jgi:hypothetical protein
VELPVIGNLMLPPPSPKPPYAIHGDVDITVLLSGVEIVCAKWMVIKIELLMDSNHCILREDLVDGNRYDNSILELAFVPFNALILYVKCSKSFAHKVAIYIFQVWNAHYVFDVMPKMLLVSLNSQIVGLISIVLDDKELLSCEFVSRYCVVGVIQFIIEVYDQLRWITCYGYSVVLPKILIGKHIHERWQQKSQEPHSQFGVIVDHDECEKVTLFNIGLALKTVIIFIDLEDKIIFRGVGNDIIYIVLIPCLFSNILCKEKTIGDIKVVEVKMM